MTLRDERSSDSDEQYQQQQQQQRPQNNTGRIMQSNASDNPDVLVKMLIESIKKLWYQLKRASQFVMNEMGGYAFLDRLVQWCIQHPHLAICLFAASTVSIFPMLFLFGTILMTFTGFLFLEGTFLTILAMMLFGLLGALILILLFFAVVGIVTYFGFTHIYNIYKSGDESHSDLLNKFFPGRNSSERSRSANKSPQSQETQ